MLFQFVDLSTQIKSTFRDNSLKNSNSFFKAINLGERLLELRIRFILLVLHLQVLLNGIRRKNDRDNANDIKQCVQ